MDEAVVTKKARISHRIDNIPPEHLKLRVHTDDFIRGREGEMEGVMEAGRWVGREGEMDPSILL